MDCTDALTAVGKYQKFLEELALPAPVQKNIEELELLKKSVNPDRLKNNPVLLTEEVLEALYRQILSS